MATNRLSIVEGSPEIEIDETKLRLICSKYNILDHYGITRDHYVRLGEAKKLQMLKGFYKSKLSVYNGEGKLFVYCKNSAFVDDGWRQDCLNCKLKVIYCRCAPDDKKNHSPNKGSLVTTNNTLKVLERREKEIFGRENSLVFGNYIWKPTPLSGWKKYFLCVAPVSAIDSGILNAVQQSSKLSMTKVLKNGRMETTISAEKEPQKKNSTNLWKKDGFFSSQVCDFSIEKAHLPEMTIFCVNQGYLSYKDNKKIYYVDTYIVGQIVPLLNQPESLDEYTPLENEVKICHAKYDTVTGQFLGLENCLGYLTVRGDKHENFFDYGFSKEKSKVLYSTHKMKIPNSFSTTIFNQHRIRYESGAYFETDFSNVFFPFLYSWQGWRN